MKLIRKGGSTEQCQAITKNGSQCGRKAVKGGYCKQHYKLMKAQGKVVDMLGNDKLNEIPDPPVKLNDTGMNAWKIYCQYLIDEGRLYQPYLFGIANLCYMEEQLEQAQKDMTENGAVNVYENGIQRNGYASHFDKIQQHIRNLRADYGLTVSSNKNAFKEEAEKKPEATYSDRKGKNW